MPIRVNLPDGTVGEFPDGMSDDAIAGVLRKQFPPKEAAPNPAEGMSALERGLAGAGGAAMRLRDKIFPPANPISMLDPTKTGGQVDAETRQRKDDLAAYERNKEALGTAGKVGEVASEVALSSLPVARASNLGSAVLTKTLGRLAPAAGDVLANAAYAGITAEPENRGEAALMGGAGAAAGRLLVRTLGGVAKPFVSKDAKALIDAGVRPTPGQLFGDGPLGQMARATEDKLMSAPVAGDIIRGARTRGIEQYNNVEINRALAPLGVTVRGAGEDAIASAQRIVSDAYDVALPQTFMSPKGAVEAVQAADAALKDIPLLTPEQQGTLYQYVARKIRPQIQTGQPIEGKTWKAIDAEIGHYARQFSTAADPSSHSLGDAFYVLQQSWRDGLEATSQEAMNLLKQANTSYRGLLPAVKAADRALAQGGRFTPLQFERAAQKFGQDGDPLNAAARRVLPTSIPNSGTADRLGMVAAFASPIKTAAATGVAAALYSPMGMAFLVNGLRNKLSDKAFAYLHSLPPDEAMKFLEKLSAATPDLGLAANQLIAQMGRAMATQPPQQEVEE